MSQAMYTASSGIANAQIAINVVSNNIANMNTVAFKASNVNFSDVFYSTMSAGAPSTKHNGGVNPEEIGYGSQVASISQNFTSGTYQSTGIATNMMIQGNGFFTVVSPSDEILYTKAGNFSLDADGYLTMPNGYKVLGTTSVFGNSASAEPIKIPTLINSVVEPNNNAGSKDLYALNNAEITPGNYSITFSFCSSVSAPIAMLAA